MTKPLTPSNKSNQGRRFYSRVQAPIDYQIEGTAFRQRVLDISLSGLRVYSEKRLWPGQLLNVTLFFADHAYPYSTKIAWCSPLLPGAARRYEAGLQFVNMTPEAGLRLRAHLKSHTSRR